MEKLTQRNINCLMECIYELYSNIDEVSFPDTILSCVSKVIPAEIIAYNEINFHQREKSVYRIIPSGAIPEKDLIAFNKYMHQHPLIHLMLPRDMISCQKQHHSSFVGKATKVSDVITDKEFHKLPLYNEFYKKCDVRYQMVLTDSNSSSLITGITLNRTRRDFSEKERLILNLLAPHLIQAWKNAKKVTGMRKKLAFMEGVTFICRPTSSSGLTVRETEVLRWVAQGKTNAEIAQILNIAHGTVRKHIERIYQKLGVDNRTSATLLVLGKYEKTIT